MVNSQDIHSIIQALQAILAAKLPDATVLDVERHSLQVGTDKYPLILIAELGDESTNEMCTEAFYINTRIGIRQLYKGITEPQIKAARDREMDIIDAINANPTLSATCVNCFVLPADQPDLYPDSGTVKRRDRYIAVKYRRNK